MTSGLRLAERLMRPFKLSHGSTEENPSIILDLNSFAFVHSSRSPQQSWEQSEAQAFPSPTQTIFVHPHAILLKLLFLDSQPFFAEIDPSKFRAIEPH